MGQDYESGTGAGNSAPAFSSDMPGNRMEASSPEPQKAHEVAVDSWPLQADRMAAQDSLVESLRLLAGYYGRRTSVASLTAGLPIPASGITPDLFIRAASRVDLQAKLAARSLEELLITQNFPCLLVLENRQACLLWETRQKKQKASAQTGEARSGTMTQCLVQFPETESEKRWVSLPELEKIYEGYSFFVRPVARVDERAGPAEIETGRDWFWSALWDNRKIYGEVVLGAVFINLFAVASSLFVMTVYDRVIPNNAFGTLWVLAVGVLTVYLFDFILKNLRSTFLDHAGRKADVKISARLFEQMLGMTMSARPNSAGVMASHIREFESLRDFFTSATMTALIDLPFVFLFILLVAIIAGPVAIIPLACVPLAVAVGFVMQKSLEKITRQSMMESALKNALLFETITGLETIKVQAAEGHTQRKWEELTEKSSRTHVRSKHISAFVLNMTMLIQQVAGVGVVLLGVFLISEAKLSMGALIAAVILTGRALSPLSSVAGLLTRLHQSRESLRQLDDLMKRPVERPAGKHFIAFPSVQGKVEFQDVVFQYPGQSVPALNGVSFTIQPGEHVGIIGAVGSGKTTIERLLINLYQPTAGSVQLDGTDVRQIDPGDLRRNVGAVQQSPHLFYGSVRSNITMGHELAPDRAVLRAAELAGVSEFLRDSQAGLDTQVGERGEALSGGQRQAVAIARALLYDPPVLILDEPTASMDPASETRLMKRLVEVTKNRTTILITHKGAMLSLVEKILLIDRGRVIAFGPKDEVIRRLQARQYGTAAEQTEI